MRSPVHSFTGRTHRRSLDVTSPGCLTCWNYRVIDDTGRRSAGSCSCSSDRRAFFSRKSQQASGNCLKLFAGTDIDPDLGGFGSAASRSKVTFGGRTTSYVAVESRTIFEVSNKSTTMIDLPQDQKET